MASDSGGDGRDHDQAGGRAEARFGGPWILNDGAGALQHSTARRPPPDRLEEKGSEAVPWRS